MPSSPRFNLLFDADDTLWTNASHFEIALENWLDLMLECGADSERALALFREVETRGFRRGWYGSRRLEINMRACARKLLDHKDEEKTTAAIHKIVQRVRGPEVLIFDGVHETLLELREHHEMRLVTMGDKQEQLAKLDASGLGHLFDSIHVLADKTRRHYESLIRGHRLDRRDSWMIGNSMAKDIRPARAAGLRTCYLATGHDFSFGLNTSGIEADLVVPSFAQLRSHFKGE